MYVETQVQMPTFLTSATPHSLVNFSPHQKPQQKRLSQAQNGGINFSLNGNRTPVSILTERHCFVFWRWQFPMLFGTLAIEIVFHSFTQSLISKSEIGSHNISYSFLPMHSSSLYTKNPTRL